MEGVRRTGVGGLFDSSPAAYIGEEKRMLRLSPGANSGDGLFKETWVSRAAADQAESVRRRAARSVRIGDEVDSTAWRVLLKWFNPKNKEEWFQRWFGSSHWAVAVAIRGESALLMG
jgi:hypothetical protein